MNSDEIDNLDRIARANMRAARPSSADPLFYALLEYDKASDALTLFHETRGYWYQRDEPVTAQDRRSLDKIGRDEKMLVDALKQTNQRLILAAREYLSRWDNSEEGDQ
jgi:hypothetical protein